MMLNRWKTNTQQQLRREAKWRLVVGFIIAIVLSSPTFADTYTYDANGNITSIDKNGEIKGYNYDALDRLVNELLGITPAFEYLYDPNGNRTSIEFDNDGVLVPFNYLLNSNQLDTVNGLGYTYDAAGNILSDPEGRTFVYNDANRLWKISSNGTLVATYTYNAQGQRTRKATPTGTTLYHYDLQGNLITETDSVGTPIKEYIWQNGQPVAMISHNQGIETITYLHTDHLNTPRKATNSSGIIVWDWQSDGFGASAPNEDADGDTIVTKVNLRFPGQYFDEESGLYYNWNRYYDPQTGRYITSDPVGLQGGNNTFAYANINPLRFLDPFGLQAANPAWWEMGGSVDQAGLKGLKWLARRNPIWMCANLLMSMSSNMPPCGGGIGGNGDDQCSGDDDDTFCDEWLEELEAQHALITYLVNGGKAGMDEMKAHDSNVDTFCIHCPDQCDDAKEFRFGVSGGLH